MMILTNSISSKTPHHVLSLLLVLALLFRSPTCSGKSNTRCTASSCGDIRDISHPFRLKSDPKGCGDSRFELACENDRTVLHLYNGRYYVLLIDYFRGVIRLVDDGLQKDNRLSLPRYSLTRVNFSRNHPYYYYPYWYPITHAAVSILNCSKPLTSPWHDSSEPCIKAEYNSSSIGNGSPTNDYYLCAVLGASASDVEDLCTVYATVMANNDENYPNSYDGIHDMMTDGFNVSYSLIPRKGIFFCFIGLQYVPGLRASCGFTDPGWFSINVAVELATIFGHFAAVKFVLGAPFVLILLIYKWRRRHLAMDVNIEEFLQVNNNFLPIRYTYFDIKKITKNFKHKLGEGGYGSVYREKLRSGNEVAIKVLKKSKVNCQDFISEIATIGRIHHVNVVYLIGFCFEGSKHALIYPFMSNGSLDKHIFSKVGATSFDCKKIYKIALGVAKGMEYLHRGCDMQILHFDIKPHNILLDKNLTPKVSDFGLAKLYPTDRSIVSLTAARGTLGYMVPELFYKDIGGVSYKADVYSFGMMLMEMAGRRRNIDANIERSSRIYFPLWIYDQLDQKNPIELKEVTEKERDITMKMIVVALWCIQLSPNNRSSMKKVINMLEGDVDELQVPPKPLLYPTNSMPVVDDGEIEIELETFSSSSSTPIISASHRFEDTSEL